VGHLYMQLQQVVVFYIEYIISLLIPASNNLSPLQFYGITRRNLRQCSQPSGSWLMGSRRTCCIIYTVYTRWGKNARRKLLFFSNDATFYYILGISVVDSPVRDVTGYCYIVDWIVHGVRYQRSSGRRRIEDCPQYSMIEDRTPQDFGSCYFYIRNVYRPTISFENLSRISVETLWIKNTNSIYEKVNFPSFVHAYSNC